MSVDKPLPGWWIGGRGPAVALMWFVFLGMGQRGIVGFKMVQEL